MISKNIYIRKSGRLYLKSNFIVIVFKLVLYHCARANFMIIIHRCYRNGNVFLKHKISISYQQTPSRSLTYKRMGAKRMTRLRLRVTFYVIRVLMKDKQIDCIVRNIKTLLSYKNIQTELKKSFMKYVAGYILPAILMHVIMFIRL